MNRALPSLHVRSLNITVTFRLKSVRYFKWTWVLSCICLTVYSSTLMCHIQITTISISIKISNITDEKWRIQYKSKVNFTIKNWFCCCSTDLFPPRLQGFHIFLVKNSGAREFIERDKVTKPWRNKSYSTVVFFWL